MKRILGVVALAALVVSGCIKKKDIDFKNVTIDNWQPDWALPIINSQLTLKNLVQTGTTVTEDPDGLYSLHYRGDLFYARASDYIFIPNQSYSTPSINLSIPQTSGSFTGNISDSFSNHFNYADANGAQLSHISVKTGNISFAINSTFRHNVSVTLVFPTVTKGGSVLEVSTGISYPSTSSSANIDLSGYTIDLTNGGSTKNYLPYKVRFSLAGTGQPLAPGDNISLSVNMTDVSYSFIDGFLGTYAIPIPSDTIDVAIFDNTLTANIYIQNPKINLSFKNSFGLGVSAGFDDIYGLTNKGAILPMTVPTISVAGASVAGNTQLTDFIIDSTNSTIQSVFNPAPNHVVYGGNVRINPGGTSNTYSFLTDSSYVSLSADAELPAWFNILDFALQDTIDLTLPEDTSILETAEFKMLMDNAFPLYGRIQLYFADANYNFLDSLVPTSSDIVGEAPVDADGVVSGRTQAVTTFNMTKTQYNSMAPKVKYAVIRGSLKSSGDKSIKVLSSDNIIVKLAFRFKLNVSSTGL